MRVSSSQGIHPTAESMYRFIIRFKRMHAGDSPSRREIQAALDIPSTSMVQHHLVMLEQAGLIVRPSPGDARRIGIPGAIWQFDEAGVGANKCASSAGVDGIELPEEERKVRERLGVLEGVPG